jgi:hypothetical protein
MKSTYDEAFPEGAPPEEYPPPSSQELFDADVALLAHQARRLITHCRKHNIVISDGALDMTELLEGALDQFEPWMESNDPRDMGWVDDKGRP